MNRDINQWLETLKEMCRDTDYDAVLNGATVSNQGVAIVPKGRKGPQRICVYPKKTKGAGLVIEMDVYKLISQKGILKDYKRSKSNRPHYNDLSDEIIIEACSIFLNKI